MGRMRGFARPAESNDTSRVIRHDIRFLDGHCGPLLLRMPEPSARYRLAGEGTAVTATRFGEADQARDTRPGQDVAMGIERDTFLGFIDDLAADLDDHES